MIVEVPADKVILVAEVLATFSPTICCRRTQLDVSMFPSVVVERVLRLIVDGLNT